MPEHYDPEFDPDQKVTIKVPKDNGKSDTVIRGSVNGQAYSVATEQEVKVPLAVAQALADSGIKYEVVDDAGAGLPTASTAPLTDTATRLVPNVNPADAGGDEAPKVATLEGGDGDTGVGGASAVPADTGGDFEQGLTNAEGQGVAAAGGPRVGNDGGDKVQADVSKGEENADGHGSTGSTGSTDDSAEDTEDKPADETGKETVADLKTRIAEITDVDTLRAEHDKEQQAGGRTTALAAIDQRIDALTQNA